MAIYRISLMGEYAGQVNAAYVHTARTSPDYSGSPQFRGSHTTLDISSKAVIEKAKTLAPIVVFRNRTVR